MGSGQSAKPRSLDLANILGGARTAVDAINGRLPFHHVIGTRLSTEVIWSEIERALTSSPTSMIWPNELETVVSDGVEPHAILQATYKLPFTKKTFHYKVTDYEKGRRLSYQALKDHVFTGGVDIEVRPAGSGSVLEWRGEYKFDITKMREAAAFRFYFRNRFFKRLEENIRNLERELMPLDRRPDRTTH